MTKSLSGKTFVVTGATSGIGAAAAAILARQGAAVIGVGRSAERCERSAEQIREDAPGAKIAYCLADLSIQGQIRALAPAIRKQLAAWETTSLDGLVNNAGTFTFWQTLTAEGFEMQWAVNHLAPFLLTHELLPLLKTAAASRVVTVSSGAHYRIRKLNWDDIQLRKAYNPLKAYKQTKLANVLFTVELNRRLGERSTVRAFAADPGLVNTKIGLKGNPGLARWIWNCRRQKGIAPEESAQGVVFLVSDPTVSSSPEIYWKHGTPQPPNPYALDAGAGRRLWELSAKMCGLLKPQVAEHAPSG